MKAEFMRLKSAFRKSGNSSCHEQIFKGKEEEFVVPSVERELLMTFILLEVFNAQVAQTNS